MKVGSEVVPADAVVIAMGPWSVQAAQWLPIPKVPSPLLAFIASNLLFYTTRRDRPGVLRPPSGYTSPRCHSSNRHRLLSAVCCSTRSGSDHPGLLRPPTGYPPPRCHRSNFHCLLLSRQVGVLHGIAVTTLEWSSCLMATHLKGGAAPAFTTSWLLFYTKRQRPPRSGPASS